MNMRAVLRRLWRSLGEVRGWALLSALLTMPVVLLAGCGIAGSAAGFPLSAIVPWLLITSLTLFIVGCGSPRFGGGGGATPTATAVAPQTATALKFITQPSKGEAQKSEALTPIAPAPQVAVVDTSGSTVTAFTGPITVALGQNPSNAVLEGTLTVNAVNGVATFTDLRVSRAAAGYTLVATAGTLTADTSVAFIIDPLTPVFTMNASRRDFSNGLPITHLTSGATASAQVSGDFNGDGHLDMAVAAYNASPSVTVLLGDGKGGFSAPHIASSNAGMLLGLAAADFNGDGKTDLACSNVSDDNLVVLLSNGDGTFASKWNSKTNIGSLAPVGLVTGDFNRDGKADLAVGCQTDATRLGAVLLGNGNGTFQNPIPFGADAASASLPLVTTGRFNNDSFDDLAVTNDGKLTTLLGNGDGTFATAATSTVTAGGSNSLFIPTAARVNSDASTDLLVNSGFQFLNFLAGDGAGGFAAATQLPLANVGPAAVADLDGNGLAETIATKVNNVGQAPANYLLEQLDSGGFRFFATSYQLIYALQPVPLFGDFNEDGRTDVIASSLGTSSVLLGDGAASFREPATTGGTASNVVASALADADGDGTLDLLTTGGSGQFGFQTGQGAGMFGTASSTIISPDATGMAVGDLNSDGRPDVVVSSYKSTDVNVLLNQGGGAFTFSVVDSAQTTKGVVLADVNGDGRLDVVASTDTAHGGTSEIVVLLGKGDGTFQNPSEYATTNTPTVPQMADFNGDGALDIAVSCSGGQQVDVLLGNGNGTFKALTIASMVSGANGVVVGDFNGDGKPDIAGTAVSGEVALLLGKGDGTFTAGMNFLASAPLSNGVAVDFNLDGALDLLIGSNTFSDVTVVLGNGDGTFTPPVYVGTNGPAPFVSVADINGDGKPDIVTPDGGSATNTVNLHQ